MSWVKIVDGQRVEISTAEVAEVEARVARDQAEQAQAATKRRRRAALLAAVRAASDDTKLSVRTLRDAFVALVELCEIDVQGGL